MPLNVMTSPSVKHAAQQPEQQQQKECPPQAGLEVKDFEENTQLILEASQGNVEGVRRLLSRGANVDSQNIYGYTALTTALVKGFTQIAFDLLDAGANVHISSLEGLTPLHMAAIHCDESMVSKIVGCGAFLGAQDEEGDSLVHWVVREGKRDILSFLINKSVHLDTKNEDGETSLHLAAALGDEIMVELLLKNGASPSVKDNEGLTPFDHAKDNSHFKVARLLAKESRQNNPRHNPYRRSCGDTHGEYERKVMSQHLPKLSPPNFC